ncbi:MAG: FeoB-associated Cys-rich membrane protein [Polaribacter sp.]|nr:FeoB-associated Cys-rich membrane protein [Polaribacter sp.]
MQEILIYISLGLAVLYLLRKFIFKGKHKGNCDTDCGCH